MPASALLIGASAAVRAASLNLCTDELLLLLGQPRQIVSVTHLSQQESETPLWREARRYLRNDGSLLSASRHRPDLVLSMGGGARDRLRIAARLSVRLAAKTKPKPGMDRPSRCLVADHVLVAGIQRVLDAPIGFERIGQSPSDARRGEQVAAEPHRP